MNISTIKYVFDKLRQYFHSKHAASAAETRFFLHVGEAVQALEPVRMMRYRHGRRGAEIESLSQHEWKSMRGSVVIEPAGETNPHTLVVGMSGMGKSTLLKSFLTDIGAAGMSAIVFDAHNEYAGIVSTLRGSVHNAQSFGLNPFELDGLRVEERISELATLFKEVYGLGYIQVTKLMECMRYAYRKAHSSGAQQAPNISMLLREINIFLSNARLASERSTLLHLRSRLSLLNTDALNREFIDAHSLMHGIHSFSLAGLQNAEARYIYMHELLSRIYALMHSNEKEHGLRMFIVIDEAQTLLDRHYSESGIVRRLMEEGRKYGIGIIAATTSIAPLPRQMLANAANFIAFRTVEPQEARYIARLLSRGSPDAAIGLERRLAHLGVNEVMLVADSMPVIARSRNAASLPAPAQHNQAAMPAPQFPKHPCRRAELEARIGIDAVNRAISEGTIVRFAEASGPNATEWLMRRNPSLSIEHEVRVRLISESLQRQGIRNYVIDNSNGPDILALIDGRRVAIEYETGRKSARETASMLKSREARYDSVLVFVNEDAYQFYRNNFEDGKVRVLRFDGSFRLTAAASPKA